MFATADVVRVRHATAKSRLSNVLAVVNAIMFVIAAAAMASHAIANQQLTKSHVLAVALAVMIVIAGVRVEKLAIAMPRRIRKVGVNVVVDARKIVIAAARMVKIAAAETTAPAV